MAVAQTETARPSDTPIPTDTPIPSHTPVQSDTPVPPTATDTPVPPTEVPARSLEEIQAEFRVLVVEFLENIFEVDTVTLVRLQPGELVVELRTVYLAQDNQPDVSYIISRGVADLLIGQLERENAARITGGDNFSLNLTTYSDSGDYAYHSTTRWELLELLAQRAISYEEWLAQSNAGFR